MARLTQNDTRDGSVLGPLALVLAVMIPVLFAGEAKAEALTTKIVEVGITERIVADRQSGIALFGYDPVAYFVEGKATTGKTEFEVIWHGAAWRFANEGNRAAFVANPELYAPRFGGYDAMAIARGVAAAGDPRVFVVSQQGLFLFRDKASLLAFASTPDGLSNSQAAWPKVERTLVE